MVSTRGSRANGDNLTTPAARERYSPSRLSEDEIADEFAHFRLFGYTRTAIAAKLRITVERLPDAEAA